MKQKLKIFYTVTAIVFFAFLFTASSTYKPIPAPAAQITDLTPAITPDAKELTRITNDNLQEFAASISPDGKKILYYSVDPVQVGSKRFHINVKTLGQQGTTPLLTEGCHSPSWMADSKGFYFTYAIPTKPVIAKSKIDQGGISYISPNANGDADDNASFMKAAGKILFHTKIGGEYQIAMLEPNGLNFTLLGTGFDPTPHPTLNTFVFSKMVGLYSQIFTYDLTTGQQTQLTSGNFNHQWPRYSPDGKWIVFQKHTKREDLKPNQDYSQHLFLMNLGGGNVKQLTSGKTWNSLPEFGSDGYIYFSSNAGNSDVKRKFDNYDIWRVKPNLVD
ncbi:MAG: PD40 domain-containing protein [Chitinophagaceae bacterium]|nr:PD40 domain-containing protein [Chitinophagaceae bacterium]